MLLSLSRSRNEGSEVRSLVDKIVLHPDYNVGHTYNNDIAMMKLARPMVLNTRVAPVCLPQQNVNVAIGKMCYLSGKSCSQIECYFRFEQYFLLQAASYLITEYSKILGDLSSSLKRCLLGC